jgi:hypothetical protein
LVSQHNNILSERSDFKCGDVTLGPSAFRSIPETAREETNAVGRNRERGQTGLAWYSRKTCNLAGGAE